MSCFFWMIIFTSVNLQYNRNSPILSVCFLVCSLGNYVSLHGHFYCLPHYKQLLKSKGNADNGIGQQLAAGGGEPFPPHDKFDWRCSTGSAGSADKNQGKRSDGNKVSVVWPPLTDPPKKAFKIEEDIQLAKPQWPPPENSPTSPKHQHRKAVPRSVLWNPVHFD